MSRAGIYLSSWLRIADWFHYFTKETRWLEERAWSIFFLKCRPRGWVEGWVRSRTAETGGRRVNSALMPRQRGQSRLWLRLEFLLTWQVIFVIFGNWSSRDISWDLRIGHLFLQYKAQKKIYNHIHHTLKALCKYGGCLTDGDTCVFRSDYVCWGWCRPRTMHLMIQNSLERLISPDFSFLRDCLMCCPKS